MQECEVSDDDEAPVLITIEEPSLAESTKQKPFESSRMPPCPVTILSGFLGAGKTTLIQHILQSPDHGKRIAVIENEFGNSDGALSIESMIARDGLTSDSLQDFIELPNGCICCTVKDSLVVTLEQLLSKRADLDYILIECSGMANPGPIAAIFWLDDALESRLRLDGIVTLVDAVHIEQQLLETVEASQQIAYADRIILNKVDLLGDIDSEIARLSHVIRRIHPTAAIQSTSYSVVLDLVWILDAGCFDAERAQNLMDLQLQMEVPSITHDHIHDHGHETSCRICTSVVTDHFHTAAVSTISLSVLGTVSLYKVHQWLAAVLWPNQDQNNHKLRAQREGSDSAVSDIHHESTNRTDSQQQIYRLKGILSVQDALVREDENSPTAEDEHCVSAAIAADHRRFIVQGVHDLWDIHACTSAEFFWKDEEERVCKLIVIGRNLDTAALQGRLCRVPSLKDSGNNLLARMSCAVRNID